MDAIIQTLFSCGTPRNKPATRSGSYKPISSFDEKAPPPTLTHSVAAARIVEALNSAAPETLSLSPSPLHSKINTVAQCAGGWTEALATHVLSALQDLLLLYTQQKAVLGEAMQVAWDRCLEAADCVFGEKGFVKEHPFLVGGAVFVTLLALGILALYAAPWILEALGFAEIGIVEGSWAALWQATYRGFVPKRSLFSFFQRLGMTWKWRI